MPNIHGVPEFKNIEQINAIIEQITAKYGKFGGRRIEYVEYTGNTDNADNTDINENHYIFKMDQLVRRLIDFAHDNEGVSKEVYLALTALNDKDIELQNPENIESTGWKGLKKALTSLKSRLGRLIYKRDQMIQETKEWLSNLIKDKISGNVKKATEKEVQAFLQDLQVYCTGLDLETLHKDLESRLVAIHLAEVDVLFKQFPKNFTAIEEALAKLPQNNWHGMSYQKDLTILKQREAAELAKIEKTTAFLDKKEWSDLSGYDVCKLTFGEGTTQAVRGLVPPLRKRYDEAAAIYNQVHDLCYRSASTSLQKAQENLRAVEECLAKGPGPETQAKLEEKRTECEEALAKFQAEIDAITKRVQDNIPFTREDFAGLSRVAEHYRATGDETSANQIDEVRRQLDKDYKTRDELMSELEVNTLFSVLTEEQLATLEEKVKGMSDGPAKQDVLEKLTAYTHYEMVLNDIKSETSLEALENVPVVADVYKKKVETAVKHAKDHLKNALWEKKKNEFQELLDQDAPESAFNAFFAAEDMKYIESDAKVMMNNVFEDLQMTRKFFQDPTIEIKLPLMGYYFTNDRIFYTVDLLNGISKPRQQNYIPTDEEMKYLTEEQKQSVLGRVFRNHLKEKDIRIVNMPITHLPLCVKCGIPVCENFEEASKTEAYQAFAQPDFQLRLQRLWMGPFEKASDEDLAVIRNALESLNFQPLIKESLQMVLKMQEMGIHFSQRCPLSQQYLMNPVQLNGVLYDRHALNNPNADEVPGLGEQVEAWVELKKSPKTPGEVLFDNVFRLRKRTEVKIENSQYDNFFAAAKKNKTIIEESEACEQDVKDRALEINYTLTAMMHPVEPSTVVDYTTAKQATWLVPHLRMFTLNLETEMGQELANKMRNDLKALESTLDAYCTHAELNPALFTIMATYSEIVEKVFGSKVKLNLRLVEVTIPQKKKANINYYHEEVRNKVKLGELSIDDTCTMTLLERMVRKLHQFLEKFGLKASPLEILAFEKNMQLVRNAAIEFENQAEFVKRRIEARNQQQLEKIQREAEAVVERLQPKQRMVMRY